MSSQVRRICRQKPTPHLATVVKARRSEPIDYKSTRTRLKNIIQLMPAPNRDAVFKRRHTALPSEVHASGESHHEHGSSLDLVTATLTDEPPFSVLVIVDSYTKTCLALEADASLTKHQTVREMEKIKALLAQCDGIFIDNAALHWAKKLNIKCCVSVSIAPSSTVSAERFCRRLHDEFLSKSRFASLGDFRVALATWMKSSAVSAFVVLDSYTKVSPTPANHTSLDRRQFVQELKKKISAAGTLSRKINTHAL